MGAWMKFKDAAEILDGIPYTSTKKGRFFYDLVLKNKPTKILELGFAHGVSACYFASALHELGTGKIDCVDLEMNKSSFSPSIEEVSHKLTLSSFINVYRESSSYTWFLKKKIETQTNNNFCEPIYDIIFVDGPKDWTNDGLTFFLAEKLLRTGGLIILDDYSWTYNKHELSTGKKIEKGYVFPQLSEEEREEPQIKAIVDLLLLQHDNFNELQIIDDQIAMARKLNSSRNKIITFQTSYSLSYRAKKLIRKYIK
jgi:predicted O-methyltransferase YrrM